MVINFKVCYWSLLGIPIRCWITALEPRVIDEHSATIGDLMLKEDKFDAAENFDCLCDRARKSLIAPDQNHANTICLLIVP